MEVALGSSSQSLPHVMSSTQQGCTTKTAPPPGDQMLHCPRLWWGVGVGVGEHFLIKPPHCCMAFELVAHPEDCTSHTHLCELLPYNPSRLFSTQTASCLCFCRSLQPQLPAEGLWASLIGQGLPVTYPLGKGVPAEQLLQGARALEAPECLGRAVGTLHAPPHRLHLPGGTHRPSKGNPSTCSDLLPGANPPRCSVRH